VAWDAADGRLKHEINQVLEEALGWWGRQQVMDDMEV